MLRTELPIRGRPFQHRFSGYLIPAPRPMGGVSRSTMRMENGRAVFTGVVSLDHGGGFASVRSHPALRDLGDYTGIELTLQGDGRRYKLRLKTDPGFDAVNWETAFATDAGARQEMRFPFRDLAPVYRGEPVSGA